MSLSTDSNGNVEQCNVNSGTFTAPVVAGGSQVGFTTAARHDLRRDADLTFQPAGDLVAQAAAARRPATMLPRE